MNAKRRILAIAQRELLDFVRDWRTILTMVLVPLLLFPLLFIGLPLVIGGEAQELAATEVEVLFRGENVPDDLIRDLENRSVVVTLAGAVDDRTVDDASVRNGSLHLVVHWNETEDVYEFHLRHLSTSSLSADARQRALLSLSEWEESERNRRVTEGGMNASTTLDPVRYDPTSEDLASQGEVQGWLLSSFIPLIITVWVVTSGIQPAIDMTAGERERGSMEALLCAPARRWELLAGKWAAVSTIVLVGVVLQLGGLMFALTFLAGPSLLSTPDVGLGALLLLSVAIFAYSVMVVASELALAIRSKSVKEAGALLAPASLAVIIPAVVVQFINLDGVEAYWFAVPVVNVLLAMRELLLDQVDPVHTVVWLSTTMVYTGAALWYAQRQFNREDLVLSPS